MRELIRRHPWRLEIVPFAIVAAAFCLPLLYRQDMLARTPPWHGYGVEQTWLLRYLFRGLLVVSTLLSNVQCNDTWVRAERGKRFNWWTLYGTAFVAITGWFMSGWFFGSVWVSVLALSVVAEAFIERSRAFRLHEVARERDPEISLRPGEPFFYSEERKPLAAMLSQAAVVLSMLPAVWTIRPDWTLITMMAICSVSTLVTTRIAFSVSSERITARAGWRGASIPISDVRACTVYEYNPFVGRHWGMVTTYDGMLLYAAKLGPCLRIEAIDGKTYLLGVKHPETVCKLIQAAVSAGQ